MYKVGPGHVNGHPEEIWNETGDYLIEVNDVLGIDIYNKGGEILIDPENVLAPERYSNQEDKREITYLVNSQGTIKLPMIGQASLAGLTLREAEDLLENKYAEYYDKLFVQIRFLNKRVFVLGASGGQVAPLVNNHTTLSEVLSMSGGLDINAKAHNIRVVRQNSVWVANFSSMEGFLETDIVVQPNDIIYIEPVRKPLVESLRDYGHMLGIMANMISIAALIISVTR